MNPELYTACSRALHVVTQSGAVLRAGRAALFVLDQIGHPGLARILGVPPLVWAVELGYRLVASNRSLFSRLFFRGSSDR